MSDFESFLNSLQAEISSATFWVDDNSTNIIKIKYIIKY